MVKKHAINRDKVGSAVDQSTRFVATGVFCDIFS